MPSKYHWHVLEDFTKKFGWTHGAELGVRWGQTSKWLLETTDLHMVGVDLMRKQPENTEINQENYNHWPWADYINKVDEIRKAHPNRFRMMVMLTDEAAKLIDNESLDFVFIDADHSYKGVSNDIKTWFQKVKKTGLITGHDINLPHVKQAVEDNFSDYDTRGEDWNNIWWANLHDYRG